MLGPNGAGKSTLLAGAGRAGAPRRRRGRSVAGALLDRPAAGRSARPAGRAGRPGPAALPPPQRAGQRRVRAAQPAACPAGRREATAREWLGRFGVGDLADRRPRAALRRPGPAGRDRPGAGGRPGAAAARRAVRRPRRGGRDRRCGIELRPPARVVRRGRAAGHPRRPRRADPRRPGAGARRRPGRRGGHPARRAPPGRAPPTWPGSPGSTWSGRATVCRSFSRRRGARSRSGPAPRARRRNSLARHGAQRGAARRRRYACWWPPTAS